MSKAEHSELPWAVLDTSIVSDMTCIAVIEESGEYATYKEQREANAKFICLAVNNHSRLMTALRNLLTAIDTDDSVKASWYPRERKAARMLLAELEKGDK